MNGSIRGTQTYSEFLWIWKLRIVDLDNCNTSVQRCQPFIFFSNVTTCHLWTSWSPLPIEAEVWPTSDVGTPMRRSYVVPIRWMVIYEYEVPGGALKLSYTKLPRPWSPWGSSPSRKNPHGRTGNQTRDLMISIQTLTTRPQGWSIYYKVGN
jgi:hypothetical protein